MRVLNGYEKNYIKDNVRKLLDEKLPTWHDTDDAINKLLSDKAYGNPEVIEFITFLRRYSTQKDIDDNTRYYLNTTTKILQMNIDLSFANVSLKIEVTSEFIKKYDELTNQRIKIRNFRFGDYDNLYNKYYILFSTWTAPNSDRLKKIDELIKLIVKDFIKELK